jgi:hypothetical protein
MSSIPVFKQLKKGMLDGIVERIQSEVIANDKG